MTLSVDLLCADAIVGKAAGKQLTAKQAKADETSKSSIPFSRPDDHCVRALKAALPSHHIDAKSALFDQTKG